MNPLVLVGPAVEPVTLAEMKLYLRLDGADEDDLVSALIMAGRLTVERTARIALIDQTWRLRLPAWPAGRVVRLPFHPLAAVEAVRVGTGPGTFALVDPGSYRLDLSCEPGSLLVDTAVPDPATRAAGIEIDVTCGFGASATAVPQPLILAVRRLVAYWFETRGDTVRPGTPALPADALALVAPFTRPRLA